MKNKGIGTSIIAIIVVIVVAVGGVAIYMTLSGGGEESPTNGGDDTGKIEVSDLTLAKGMTENYEPIEETTVFHAEDTVYFIGVINNPEVGMEVKPIWYDEDGELSLDIDPLVISEAHITDGITEIYASLGPQTTTWTPGSYSVELVIDNESIETLDFEIVAEG